jgi:hypothetical protein
MRLPWLAIIYVVGVTCVLAVALWLILAPF